MFEKHIKIASGPHNVQSWTIVNICNIYRLFNLVLQFMSSDAWFIKYRPPKKWTAQKKETSRYFNEARTS